MRSSPLITVIMVNYNGRAFLKEAIASLSEQTFRDFELVLIDNASKDGSSDQIDTSHLPCATITRSAENLGFAKGNNEAATLARGKWIVLLNPDCRVDPDWLAALVRASEQHPDCRNFTSAQLNLSDESLLDGAGDAYFGFGIPWRGGFGRPASELPERGWCFSACGASAMYDATLFRELGGFDERFFCYCEDVDLGFRLQLLDEDCRFVRDAVIYHAGSGIIGQKSPFTTYHGTRNRVWTYAKNMPALAFWLTLPGHIAISLYLLMRTSFTPCFTPMLVGLCHGLVKIPEMRRTKQWKVQAPKASTQTLLSRMTWNPITLSKRHTDVRPDAAKR